MRIDDFLKEKSFLNKKMIAFTVLLVPLFGLAVLSLYRGQSTEKPFTGKYYNCKIPGIYHCSVCGLELFSSKKKYNSGTGWPSFFDVIQQKNIIKQDDYTFGMKRIEVLCGQCKSHLGHLFFDGPAPTRKRYCINSFALELKKEENKNP